MIPKGMYLACVAVAGLSCVSLFGQQKFSQDKGAGDQLIAPHWQFSATGFAQSGEGVHVGEPTAWNFSKGNQLARSVQLTQPFVERAEIREFEVANYLNASVVVFASERDTSFHINYANGTTRQVSPDVEPEIGKTGALNYRLNHCLISLVEWTKRR